MRDGAAKLNAARLRRKICAMNRLISDDEFEAMAAEAIDSLPPIFLQRLENVEIVVEKRPSAALLRELNVPPGNTLLGLYEGVPLTERTSDYGLVVPDLITLFQDPIVAATDGSREAVQAEIRHTIVHEVAHYFGISDERLHELGLY